MESYIVYTLPFIITEPKIIRATRLKHTIAYIPDTYEMNKQTISVVLDQFQYVGKICSPLNILYDPDQTIYTHAFVSAASMPLIHNIKSRILSLIYYYNNIIH